MELEPRVFWIVVILGLAIIAYCAWVARRSRKKRGLNADETGRQSSRVPSRCGKDGTAPVNYEKDDLPESPNSFDPTMTELIRANQERLRMNRERLDQQQRERAKVIAKTLLQKYEEMLPTAEKIPFPIDVHDYLLEGDLYVAGQLLAKKGWKMTYSTFANGARFELSPIQAVTARRSGRAGT